MSVFRSRRNGADPQPVQQSSVESNGEASLPVESGADATAEVPRQIEYKVPPHIERALITLTTKMQHCVERLDVLEHRLDELTEQVMNAPSHSDVLEVRLHSAKLAAELARATVELRGEIGLASDEARRAVRAARNSSEEVEAHFSVDLTAEEDIPTPEPSKIDLTKDDREGKKKPWSQSA
jgi:hypothetical protein